MLSKSKIIKRISEVYNIPEEFIELAKEDGIYYLAGKLGSILPMTELGRLTMKDSAEDFLESTNYLLSQFEGDCIVSYINNIKWEAEEGWMS